MRVIYFAASFYCNLLAILRSSPRRRESKYAAEMLCNNFFSRGWLLTDLRSLNRYLVFLFWYMCEQLFSSSRKILSPEAGNEHLLFVLGQYKFPKW